jgi:hypothetical protein
MKMGNHAFFGRKQKQTICKSKTIQNPIHYWTVFFWKCFRWSLLARKCRLWRIHRWHLVFYLENSNGWITSKAPYFIPNTLDTTASKVLKPLVCIMKLQLKRIDLDRTVFGIYRTTAFCN